MHTRASQPRHSVIHVLVPLPTDESNTLTLFSKVKHQEHSRTWRPCCGVQHALASHQMAGAMAEAPSLSTREVPGGRRS
jgi:hypothetical protein